MNSARGRLLGALVISAALLVPLAVFGAPAIAQSAAAAHQYGSACTQYGSSGAEYGSSGTQYGSSGTQYGSAGAQYGSSSCRQYRVSVCHRRHSRKHPWMMIRVSSHALAAHLRHGDTMPPCGARGHKAHGEKHGGALAAVANASGHGHDHGQTKGHR